MSNLYRQLWSRVGGRPWTFILRDIWHQTEGLCILALVAAGTVLGRYLWHEVLWYLLSFALGYVGGHLFWGRQYIPHQKPDLEGQE